MIAITYYKINFEFLDHFHLPFPSLETSKDLRLMKEDVHREYSVFLLRKSSPLIPLLDRFIFSVNEAGINHYLLNQVHK